MEYKGLRATFQFHPDACYFYGQIMLARDRVFFEAETLEKLEDSFRHSVDNYLADCAAIGIEPG